MQLNDNALTTVDAVASELGIGSPTNAEADQLRRYINAYSDMFEHRTDRRWYRKDGHTESVKSAGDTQLFISDHRPIRSIGEIKVKGDPVDAADYAIEAPEAGIIRLDDDVWRSTWVAKRYVRSYPQYAERRVEVTYDGGYVTPKQIDDGTYNASDDYQLPSAIQHAVISTVANAFVMQGAPANIDSESIGDASISFTSGGSANTSELGEHVSAAFAAEAEARQDRSLL